MSTCSECKYWGTGHDEQDQFYNALAGPSGRKLCNHSKMQKSQGVLTTIESRPDKESVRFITGKDWGCVLWEHC